MRVVLRKCTRLPATVRFLTSENMRSLPIINDSSLLRAESCYKRAIALPSSTQKRASYWHGYGVLFTTRLQLQRAAHCFIRSLQINQQNDHAWFALAVVCLRANDVGALLEKAGFMIDQALQFDSADSFYRTAQILSSDWADVWINVWASHENVAINGAEFAT